MEPKDYPSFGRCIYCGKTRYSDARQKLGAEHIIPEGLGGVLQILEASCQDCERDTNVAEHFLQKNMMAALRYHLNLPTKKKKERPQTLLLEFLINNQWIGRQVSISRFPVIILAPALPLPEIMLARDLDKSNLLVFNTIQLWSPYLIADLLAEHSAMDVRPMSGQVRIDLFARMLAKIGHAYAVAELGLDGFHPLLLKAIEGDSAFPLHNFVGGVIEDHGREQFRHHLSLTKHRFHGHNFWVVRIRLFADFGFAPYICIVGLDKADNAKEVQEKFIAQKADSLPWRLPRSLMNDKEPAWKIGRVYINPATKSGEKANFHIDQTFIFPNE